MAIQLGIHRTVKCMRTLRPLIVSLLLAITDQFDMGLKGRVDEARALLGRLTDEHDRLYYAGVIEERGGIEQYQDLWFAARTADLATSVEAIYGLTLDDLDAAVRDQYGLKPLR